jgi:hypothetical protein
MNGHPKEVIYYNTPTTAAPIIPVHTTVSERRESCGLLDILLCYWLCETCSDLDCDCDFDDD